MQNEQRMPKAEYFKMRMDDAKKRGDHRKFAYYSGRLNQLQPERTDRIAAETRAKAAEMTSAKRIAVAVSVISAKNTPFTQQQKHAYLIDCGVSETEYLEALNQASVGALLAAAGV